MSNENIKTKTALDMVSEFGDNHDTVVLSLTRVCKDGSININTDQGRMKLTLEELGEEFGVEEYLGNGVYRIK